MRIDSASQLVRAPAAAVYRAFAQPEALEAWLPPAGMKGEMLAFSFRAGGGYRMRLTYLEPSAAAGKTSPDSDEAEVKFVKLVENRRVEQTAQFESDDPEFHGEMRIAWTLEPQPGGTLVTVTCTDVPPGIAAKDHEEALASTLTNLAAYVENTPLVSPD